MHDNLLVLGLIGALASYLVIKTVLGMGVRRFLEARRARRADRTMERNLYDFAADRQEVRIRKAKRTHDRARRRVS